RRLSACLEKALELHPEEARMTVEHFIRAEQSCKPCHGLVRVAYLLNSGKFGPYGYRTSPPPKHLCEGRIHADGEGHLGYVTVQRIVEAGCEEALRHGFCVATSSSVYPSGMLGDWARIACRYGVGMFMVANSPPRVTGPHSAIPLVGTNPFCIALPIDPIPFVADSSTSAITHGDLLHSRANKLPLPPDVAVDVNGNPTSDASQVDPTKGL
ncbi:MAG: Ldh family oxidoreductase, partial [Planctomycetes bacterium]|nr:Ldh family oxidoreductase [Planctomycetota bacterium]